ncbi:MAG TPA: methyltransferase dimerization domain-containing protein [Terriglobia bacterium]|nr:methyltransferase dimerization domain-containing protein [Terriglobia bacterium]
MSVTTQPDQATVPLAPVALIRLATGYMVSQAVYVAAKLGLADLIAAGPYRADELAKEVGADASALRRLLRMLATCGVFSEDERGHFLQSPVSELLRSGVPGSLRYAVIMWNEEQYLAWGQILHSVWKECAFRPPNCALELTVLTPVDGSCRGSARVVWGFAFSSRYLFRWLIQITPG